MKVLLGHNFYRSSSPSGEDMVYQNERSALERQFQVVTLERHNDHLDASTFIKGGKIAIDSAWSQSIYLEVKKLILQAKPDIAHFHNTFPQISASAYAACREMGVPVVQTLHNFRSICANGLLMRDGAPCEDCVGHSLLPALRHRCYRDSLVATAGIVWMMQRNRWRGVYDRLVDCYIAPSAFAAGRLMAGGLPADRIKVKGHFLPDPPPQGEGRGGYALFVGRLSEEKGVGTLLRAWGMVPNLPLRIMGEGNLGEGLREEANRGGQDIAFLGARPHSEVLAAMGDAAMVIAPSLCYETFGLSVMESFAMGTPVVASRIGSLAELVEDDRNGKLFRPGDPGDLATKVQELLLQSDSLATYRANARRTFEEKFTLESHLHQLNSIYSEVLDRCEK